MNSGWGREKTTIRLFVFVNNTTSRAMCSKEMAKNPEDARNQFLKISFQLRLLLVKVYCMQIYSVMPSGSLVIVNEFFT